MLAAFVALLALSPASAHLNGSDENGGVSLETDASTPSLVDGRTQRTGAILTYLNVSLAAPGQGIGDRSYDFDFTAPTTIGSSITFDLSGSDFTADASDTAADDWNTSTLSIPTVIPESETALLLTVGLGILGFVGRRRTP